MILSDEDLRGLAEALAPLLARDLADEVAARVERAASLPGGRGLIPLQEFADRRGVSRDTIYNWRDAWGFAIRDGAGAPKEPGDRSASYIYIPEVERKEKMHTRSVTNGMGT